MPEIIKHHETTIYDGPRFEVKRAEFRRPDGEDVTREWIEPGDAVAVLPYSLRDNYFIMARQPREITGREVLSLCAGKIDPGESPGIAAERELREELGMVPSSTSPRLSFVGEFYSSEGITTEKTYIFLAQDFIVDHGAELDTEEAVTAVRFPLSELGHQIDLVDNAKAAIALRELKLRLMHKTLLAAADEITQVLR